MGRSNKTAVELSIPSILGYEKIAMEAAAAVAREMGFSKARVEDLRTAVSEACQNAIEHGNRQDASVKVLVTFTISSSKLRIEVVDRGLGIPEMPRPPSIDAKIAGKERPRGWGIFLIEKLVDEVAFEQMPEGGNVTRLIIHLKK